jgi:hypothetical protein
VSAQQQLQALMTEIPQHRSERRDRKDRVTKELTRFPEQVFPVDKWRLPWLGFHAALGFRPSIASCANAARLAEMKELT